MAITFLNVSILQTQVKITTVYPNHGLKFTVSSISYDTVGIMFGASDDSNLL